MRQGWLGIITLLALGSPTAAQATEDLLSIFAQSRAKDPRYHAAEQRYINVSARYPEAISQLLPQLQVQMAHTRNQFGTPTQSNNHVKGTTLSLSQSVFNHSYFVGLRKATFQIQQSVYDLRTAEQDLMVRTAEAYFGTLLALDSLQFAYAEMQSFKQLSTQSKNRFKAGAAAITDVHDAESKADNAIARYFDAQNFLEKQLDTLAEITGNRNIYSLTGLQPQIPLMVPEPNDMSRWEKVAKEYNSTLRSAQLNVKITKQDVRKQYAENLPNLEASGYLKRGNSQVLIPDVSQRVGTLTLTIPVFSGGAVYARTKQAAAKNMETKFDAERALREAISKTRQSFRGVNTQIETIETLAHAVKSSLAALKATQSAYQWRTRTMVDLLNAQKDVFDAKRNYAKARYNYILESLRLKQATGMLQVADLSRINEWLTQERDLSEQIDRSETPEPTEQAETPQSQSIAPSKRTKRSASRDTQKQMEQDLTAQAEARQQAEATEQAERTKRDMEEQATEAAQAERAKQAATAAAAQQQEQAHMEEAIRDTQLRKAQQH